MKLQLLGENGKTRYLFRDFGKAKKLIRFLMPLR